MLEKYVLESFEPNFVNMGSDTTPRQGYDCRVHVHL